MAYNPNMYNTYGQMYGNSYGMTGPQGMANMQGQNYGAGYGQGYGQSYGPGPVKGEIEWVDGEVGAKAYQIPAGCTKPVALWDTNDTVIYLKSVNPYGIPNPLQKIHYRMEEMVPKYMGQDSTARLESGSMGGTVGSGAGGSSVDAQDMSGYVRKEELEAMRDELKEAISSMHTPETRGAKSNVKSAV